MADPFIGEVRVFSFAFAPLDWAACDGQSMPIQQYQALNSVIGGLYGPMTPTQFVLPNLQAEAVVGVGTGPGLSKYTIGQKTGTVNVTLNVDQTPQHTHTAHVQAAQSATQLVAAPAEQSYLSLAETKSGTTFTALTEFTPTANTTLAPNTITPAGAGQAHENRQPFLTMMFCIALMGEYPMRPS